MNHIETRLILEELMRSCTWRIYSEQFGAKKGGCWTNLQGCAILITSHSSKLQLSRFKMLRKANKQIYKLYVLSFREFLMHLSLNSRSSRKNGVRRKTKYNLAEQQEIKRNRFVSGIFTKGQGGHSIIASHIKVKIGTFFLMVNNCINFI